MLNSNEIREIFNSNVKEGVLEGCTYLEKFDYYWLHVNFDPGVTDPHEQRSSDLLLCIDGKSKKLVDLSFDQYLETDSKEIEIGL